MGLPPGLVLSECLTDDGSVYLQGAVTCRRGMPLQDASLDHGELDVRNVMTFARYCKRKK